MKAKSLPNHSIYKLLGTIMLLSLLFSACGGAPTGPATESPTMTDTPTQPPEPTLTSTATLAPTATFTPTPTLVPLQRISVFNASQIEQIYQMGLGTVRSAAWSPDGQMLVMASSVGLYVYDMQAFWNDKKTATLSKFIEYPDLNIVTFSPDGTHFATGTRNGSIQVWDKGNLSLLFEFEGLHQSQVTILAFDPDSKFLIYGGPSGIVEILNVENQRLQTFIKAFIFSGFGAPTITNIAFSNDGTQIYLGGRGDFSGVKIYTFPDGAQYEYAEIPDSKVFAFSNVRGLIAVGTGDYSGVTSLITYDFETLRPGQRISEYDGFYTPLSNFKLTFSPNGRFLASSIADSSQFSAGNLYTDVMVWDTGIGTPGCRLQIQEQTINWIGFSPDSSVLAISGPSGISLWDAEECTHIITLDQHASVIDMAFSDKERIQSVSQNGLLAVWDVPTNSIVQQWELANKLTDISFSTSGNNLATLTSEGISVLEIEDNRLSSIFELPQNKIEWIDMGESDISTYLAYSFISEERQIVTVVDVDTQNVLRTFSSSPSFRLGDVDLSPDGRKLMTTGYLIADLWDIQSGQKTQITGCSYVLTSGLTFSNQGTLLAEICSDFLYSFIYLLDMTNNKVLWFAKVGELIDTPALVFSQDEAILAAGDSNGMVYLWDVRTGGKIAEWRAHYDPVNSLMFSKNGNMLVSGSEDGTIRVWGIR